MSYLGFKKADLSPVTHLGTAKLMPMDEQLPIERIVIPYTPRDIFRPYHNRKQRFAITVAHRRAGKTVAEVNEGAKKLLNIKLPKGRVAPPQVAFISPTFGQSKRNAWPYAKHFYADVPGIKIMEGDLTLVMPNGGK